MITVQYILLSFSDINFKAFDIPKLRGFFASYFPKESLFHNHLPGGSLSYKFPQIQYRVIDNHPCILGIGDGIELIKRVFLNIDELKIGKNSYQVNDIQVSLFEENFGQGDTFYNYRFLSPWMALNQENYRDFVKLNTIQQKVRLKQILKGNLLTLSKGFGYTIKDFDQVELDGWFKPIERNFHNIPMRCFGGEFTINFAIPSYLAVGKQVARGFGVVESM